MSILLRRMATLSLCVLLSPFTLAAIREYHLNIAEQTVNVTGKPVKKITVNGQFPAPTLAFEEGDEAVIHVHNQLKNQETALHWHGILLPALMDGVPGFNGFKGIKPNADFTYRFKLRQTGTYWYHAHSVGQEQDGLYGAFIVYPKGHQYIDPIDQADRDEVVMLSDFHSSSSNEIMKNLKKSADYYQNQRETLADVWQQAKTEGIKNTWQDRKMWNQMRMLKTDLSDVTGYTFLLNGKTPTQNWTADFKQGEKMRLRFINASAMSFFDVRIPNLKMTVVAADGQPVQPVSVDEFRFGAGETYDVMVEPKLTNYQLQAESIDRSGFALGQLHQIGKTEQKFAMPSHRPRALLSMQDMPMSDMKHDMPMSDMKHDMPMSNTKHDMPIPSAESKQAKDVEGWANASTPVGEKALQYQALKARTPQADTREPTRTIDISLDGNMERYIWTMNGQSFAHATPLQVKFGERVRLRFTNNTMMAHPMHLHGMFVQLENGQSLENLPNKHTIIVPPAKTVSVLLTADELGEWAIHCHLLYHMTSGMMNKLVVGEVQTTAMPQQQESSHAHH
ncbi:multicopper oxidase domain-containing protein [Acinetobacter sp. MD2]|uniref:multicopper oxidase domain-containing protein n=1 Tax=Acinetobacter sp. MD2 TaxID=2600066 RepID=UPI002D1F364A|nr:multicopper oxidase domain-containing protein [Acinetobacter sp. MD2]MEB3768087.1 multicopper oxidase domain-containing protein [Acinetobacter sp. MD2]